MQMDPLVAFLLGIPVGAVLASIVAALVTAYYLDSPFRNL